MKNKTPIIVSAVCGCIFIAMMISAFCEHAMPMQTPPLEWKFEATDSGMYFNEYTKGKLTRKFGPVQEYKKQCKICKFGYHSGSCSD